MVTDSSLPSGLAINRSLPRFSSAGNSFCSCPGSMPRRSGRIQIWSRWAASVLEGLASWADYRTISHDLLMFERAFKQIGDDLHIAMRMRGKTMSGLHPIFVDDSKGAESHVVRIVILIERKTVAGV